MSYYVGADQRYPLIILAVVSIGLYLLATTARKPNVVPRYTVKQAVCQQLVAAQGVIKAERLRLHVPMNAADRLQTGWIGVNTSAYTTDPGSLAAKRSVTNPNIGAVVVDMLVKAGVKQHSIVAIGMTGSFPALDAAVIIAVEKLGARPLIISSVGASQWGANEPEFTWPVMERALYDAGIIHTRSLAFTRGGSRALPLETIAALDNLVARSGIQSIDDAHLTQSVRERIRLYEKAAGGRHIAAFVNIGGAIANVGIAGMRDPRNPKQRLGVMQTFEARHIPTIDLRNIRGFCRAHQLPWDPIHAPSVGSGKLFVRNKRLSVVVGICLMLQLLAMILVGWWQRRSCRPAPLELAELVTETSAVVPGNTSGER